MSRTKAGMLESDLKRLKRRASMRMNQAYRRMKEAMENMQNIANQISLVYERDGEKNAFQRADHIVVALRSKNLYTVDQLEIIDEVTAMFNSLPEEKEDA